MYSIFNTKSRKRYYLEEGEAPPKKIVTDGNILIKSLSEKQLKTSTSLNEELTLKKDFVSSEKYTDISNHISGKINLNTFKQSLDNVEKLNILKNKHLSERDIEMLRDYNEMDEKFWDKYKHMNKDILIDQITNIIDLLKSSEKSNTYIKSSLSRHQEQYLNSLKPNSLETKLLKFVSETQKIVDLPGPMDELPDIEKRLSETIKDYSSIDYKKIQKKARSIGNKITNLKCEIRNIDNFENNSIIPLKQLGAESKWDVHERVSGESSKIINKSKIYDCKPQMLYTIRNGQIVQLNSTPQGNQVSITDKSKLTLDEIKKIPKFANYEPGIPSKILFLKNLAKNTNQDDFNNLLRCLGISFTIRLMTGKMRGQAFIQFEDVSHSTQALEILNGVILKGKPVIAQYGNKT
ncbi:hypothetical protein GWI33_005010 [Rhynchophorus ferrugineus]|uniref:RRM domain-containing protein n=1 Tax=Rhynchophorus ferrugineus TaxID=354439 RepID=A0A834MIC2_RHYFE|nr:hypothetical protein GWI33_005010 [Rhynchophorus ferrugineus]